jgi:hypothetical protein
LLSFVTFCWLYQFTFGLSDYTFGIAAAIIQKLELGQKESLILNPKIEEIHSNVKRIHHPVFGTRSHSGPLDLTFSS